MMTIDGSQHSGSGTIVRYSVALAALMPNRVYLATALRARTNVLHLSDPIPWDERIEIDLNGA
jgi:hypothetical protein